MKPVFEMSTIERILNDELKRYGRVKADQDEAIQRVTRAFLTGDVKAGMSSDEIAKVMQKPVDNIPITNITQNAAGAAQMSLRPVAPVQPSSNAWSRTHDTAEAMEAYPNLWNVAAEESEKRNPTQIASTQGTYRNIYKILQREGFTGKILDASSGLGLGTKVGREEFGFDVDDIEPYPDASYKPRYTDYSKLHKKYDAIISSAVLNVLPQDQRDALVVKMGELLNPGGRMFITTRGKDVETLGNTGKNIHLGNMEWIETVKGSYQKGFTQAELKAYLEDALGPDFTVELSNAKNGGKFNNNTSIVVTKKAATTGGRAQLSAKNVDASNIEDYTNYTLQERVEYAKELFSNGVALSRIYSATKLFVDNGGRISDPTDGKIVGSVNDGRRGQEKNASSNGAVSVGAEERARKGAVSWDERRAISRGTNRGTVERTKRKDLPARWNDLSENQRRRFEEALIGHNDDATAELQYFRDTSTSDTDYAKDAYETFAESKGVILDSIIGALYYDAESLQQDLLDALEDSDQQAQFSARSDSKGDQTQTQQFKKWFGNSKVVDEDGKPLVVYHGTEADFTVFDRTKGRSTMDIQSGYVFQ